MGLHPQSLRIPGLSIALCTACLGVGLMAQPVTDCNSNGIADAIDLSPSIAVREARSVSLASGPQSAALGDVDQDGILELFVVNVASDDLVILRGSIDGSFHESRHYALNDGHGLLTRAWTQEMETGSSFVTTADLDGDGVVDIAAAMAGISVIRNATRNDANLNGRPDDCDVSFLRGDCDGDGLVSGTVNDAVFLLRYLFIGGDTPPCPAACDSNADGVILGAVTDAVHILRFSFLGSAPPPVAVSRLRHRNAGRRRPWLRDRVVHLLLGGRYVEGGVPRERDHATSARPKT